MRRNYYCQACSFARDGVKTRKAIEHTCGKDGMLIRVEREYIPTRRELDMYIARLKELMQEDDPENRFHVKRSKPRCRNRRA